MPKHRAGHTNAADSIAARELDLYAENTQELYRQYQDILRNLLRKIRSKRYDASKAPTLWLHWYDTAAKRYAKEFGHSEEWAKTFTKATRMLAAKERAEQEHRALLSGEHDYLLGK